MIPTANRRDRPSLAPRPADLKRPFLEHTARLRVRFHEVDSLHIVWHGHYVTYLEEARRAFGRQYGIDYTAFIDRGIAVPVVQLHLDYLAPARLADELDLTARLYHSESAKLEFDYTVRRVGDGQLLTTGSTLQVFTTPAGELLLQWPEFMVERYRSWDALWQRP